MHEGILAEYVQHWNCILYTLKCTQCWNIGTVAERHWEYAKVCHWDKPASPELVQARRWSVLSYCKSKEEWGRCQCPDLCEHTKVNTVIRWRKPLTLITPAPVCANMIQILVHTYMDLGCSIFVEINVKRQSNPFPLIVFNIYTARHIFSQAQLVQNII